MAKKEKDIPKATIAVLLVLTILVSVVGTWTVLESISSREKQIFYDEIGISQGSVNLNIEKTRDPIPDDASVMLNIEKPN